MILLEKRHALRHLRLADLNLLTATGFFDYDDFEAELTHFRMD